MGVRQITLKRVERPSKKGFERELERFCEAFGISPENDSLSRDILREILKKESSGREGIRSIIISRKMHVTRGGAIYHLNRLMDTGLIVRRGRQYELRGQNLRDTVEEMEEDMRRLFKNMRRMAAEIDEELGIDG